METKFLNNRYRAIYFRLVSADDAPGQYREKHHILPKCLGGKNGNENVVLLTGRKHYLAHWILTKITAGPDRRKLLHAFACMARNPSGKRILTAWQYERARVAQREALIGRPSPLRGRKYGPEVRAKISAATKGRKLTSAHKKKISDGLLAAEKKPGWPKGKPAPERVARLAEINKGNKYRLGHTPSAQTRIKLSEASKGNKSRRGMKDSVETRRRKSEAQKRRYTAVSAPISVSL